MGEAESADLPKDKGFLHLKQQMFRKSRSLQMVTPLLIQKAIIVLGPTVIAVSTHHTHTHPHSHK